MFYSTFLRRSSKDTQNHESAKEVARGQEREITDNVVKQTHGQKLLYLCHITLCITSAGESKYFHRSSHCVSQTLFLQQKAMKDVEAR